VIYKNKNKL